MFLRMRACAAGLQFTAIEADSRCENRPGGAGAPATRELDRMAGLVQGCWHGELVRFRRLMGMDFRTLFEALPSPFMVLDTNLRFVEMNPRYLEVTGRERDDLIGTYVFDAFPESPEREAIFRDAFQRALAGEENMLEREPFSIPDENGGMREVVWRCTHSPIRDANGAVTHLVQNAVDITVEYKAQQRNQIIARELDHRVKNLLAVIGSIGRLTAKNSMSMEAFLEAFNARLEAIARTHSVLANADWEGAELKGLIEQELAAYGAGESKGILVEGPPVFLPPRDAQAMSMALHELATNAAKYGALSRRAAKLSVTWELVTGGGFSITWRESGLQGVTPSERQGFGTLIIDRVAPYELSGEAHRTFEPTGMVWTLRTSRALVERADGSAEG